jgi:hypothetical protein
MKPKHHVWRQWHEREKPVKIDSTLTNTGLTINVASEELTTSLSIEYPQEVWEKYHKNNKEKYLENVSYVFTAHLPFLLRGNIRMTYTTGRPTLYTWAQYCLTKFLPHYWYWTNKQRGTHAFPMLKTMLNSRVSFERTADIPPQFPETLMRHVVIPFTFGKDSFLTYHIAKEIGLTPTLVYFNEPTEEYSRSHKLALIKQFTKKTGEVVHFMDNPLGNLRALGDGWYGWELALTSWALLALPFCSLTKSAYILFSNEHDTNDFFYDDDGLRVITHYEQSAEATEELSILTESLTEGEVYVSTFLQPLYDSGIITMLKRKYRTNTFEYLMSCWAENKNAQNKRWCATCSKCARLYLLMTAAGIDPMHEAGFEDNMFVTSKRGLYNVFTTDSQEGGDQYGLNTNEQALAFYICWLSGNRSPLVQEYRTTTYFADVQENFEKYLNKYYCVQEDINIPPQWKKRLLTLYERELKAERKELMKLYTSKNKSM